MVWLCDCMAKVLHHEIRCGDVQIHSKQTDGEDINWNLMVIQNVDNVIIVKKGLVNTVGHSRQESIQYVLHCIETQALSQTLMLGC